MLEILYISAAERTTRAPSIDRCTTPARASIIHYYRQRWRCHEPRRVNTRGVFAKAVTSFELALGEDLGDDLVVFGCAEDGVELLLRRPSQHTLVALSGVEDLECWVA